MIFRYFHAAAYSPPTNSFYIHGGLNLKSILADFWRFDIGRIFIFCVYKPYILYKVGLILELRQKSSGDLLYPLQRMANSV
jgi:hypothetical protein